MSECMDCRDKDAKIEELTQQLEESQVNIQALRGALENAHEDPDMILACLDSIRSRIVDDLRRKYLQAGAMSRSDGDSRSQ